MLQAQHESGIPSVQLEAPLVGHWTFAVTRGVRKHAVSLQPEPRGAAPMDVARAQELICVWSVQPDAGT